MKNDVKASILYILIPVNPDIFYLYIFLRCWQFPLNIFTILPAGIHRRTKLYDIVIFSYHWTDITYLLTWLRDSSSTKNRSKYAAIISKGVAILLFLCAELRSSELSLSPCCVIPIYSGRTSIVIKRIVSCFLYF